MGTGTPKNRKMLSHILGTFFSFGLFIYFGFHLMHGERGYFAWRGIQLKLVENQKLYERLEKERMALENRVKLLRPDSLDIDMLDERARVVLGFAKPEEIVILTNN